MKIYGIIILLVLNVVGWYNYYKEANDKHSVSVNDFYYIADKDKCVRTCGVIFFDYSAVRYTEGKPFNTVSCECKRTSGAATYFKHLELIEE